MLARPLQIGLVGAGHMAKVHARQWAKIPNASIIGIASHEPSHEIPGCSKIPRYTTLTAMLNDLSNLDVIDICTPTPSHLTLACEAIAAKKHVFLEKPATRRLDECDVLINCASKSSSKVMVGHVVRFFPEFANAHEHVASGLIGIPAAVRTSRLMGKARDGYQDWYSDESQSGGLILDVLIHDFDWLIWTIGDIDRVFAKAVSVDATTSGVDYAMITLHHKNGAISLVTGSRVHGSFQTIFEVCGDSGMLEHDSNKSASLSFSNRTSGESGIKSPRAFSDDPYFKELSSFTNAIINDTDSPISLTDARKALRVALAAIESVSSGNPVELT